MTQASDKLAQSRRAILDHIARRERRHDPREEGPGADRPANAPADPAPRGAGWIGRVKHAVRTWWRYHPAHMAAEVATPVLAAYARQKPVQVLAFSAVGGALLVFARPWRLISVSAVLVAVLKSSQLSGLLLSALSAADFESDQERPE